MRGRISDFFFFYFYIPIYTDLSGLRIFTLCASRPMKPCGLFGFWPDLVEKEIIWYFALFCFPSFSPSCVGRRGENIKNINI